MSPKELMKEKGIGYSCQKGAKAGPNQDDFCILVEGSTTILGVFDGHGVYGHFCSYSVQQLLPRYLLSSRYYKENLEKALKEAIDKIDEALRGITQYDNKFSILMSGTTGAIVVRRGDNLYIANVGDSRAVLARRSNEKEKLVAVPLTHDHTPETDEEKKRVEASGGEVRKEDKDGPLRIFFKRENFPGLAMSRSFGDEVGKAVGVISEPEIYCRKIEKEDRFIMIGSDGLWDYMPCEEIIDTIKLDGKANANVSAKKVAEKAFNKWLDVEDNLSDDVTCLIYYLN